MNHTVLIVEDEADLRDMMREALESNGYAVVTAEDGQDALAKLPGIDHLCLVLLDLLMPVMNGWDFVEAFRRRSDLAAVPVIIHSTAPGRGPPGATRVLQKPLTFDQLLSVVHEYCAR